MRSRVPRLCLVSSFALALAAPAGAGEQAGVAAAVRGEVTLARASLPAHAVASGAEIHLDDALRSGDASGMQVLLLDETVFTLGANSEIVIDEFVYDPKSGAGRLDAEVVEGVFRFVSGKIAKERPDDVELRLPSGTIGIRGTIVAGQVGPDGSALVVLLGPGRNANTQDRPGAVRVSGAGRHVDLLQPNWATRIPGPGQPPSEPFLLSMPDLEALSQALSAGPPRPPLRWFRNATGERQLASPRLRRLGEKITASEWTGQNTAEGSVLSKQLLAEAVQVMQVKQADGVAGQTPLAGQIASISQLSAIQTGSVTYNRPGASFDNGGGFDFGFVVDFGAQQASFGMQNITSPVLNLPPGNGVTLNAITTSFASGSDGLAIFSIPASFGFGPVCTPCNVLVDAAVLNANGQVASELAGKVTVNAGPLEAKGNVGKIPGFYTP